MDYKGKRILVTGGSGFVGKHLVAALRQQEAEVFAPDHSTCDILVRPVFDHIISLYKPLDICFHLAARVGGIGANLGHGANFFQENMLMGLNVIDSCLKYRVGSVVILGSTCSYPANTPVPFKEEDLFNGYPEPTNAPYGIAKRALLVMLQAYHEQYGLKGAYPISTNLYGPGDHSNLLTSHVIPAIVDKCISISNGTSDVLSLWGTGTPTRDFLYIDDLIKGLLLMGLTENPVPINFGSGQETSILSLTHLVQELLGIEVPIIFASNKPDGQKRRLLDISKAKDLGWEPTTDLRTGLMKVIEEKL